MYIYEYIVLCYMMVYLRNYPHLLRRALAGKMVSLKRMMPVNMNDHWNDEGLYFQTDVQLLP